MFLVLEVATVVLVAIAAALALVHALEWPGKVRLAKQEYLAIQPIYYPGFTIAGAAEPIALLLVLVLLLQLSIGTLSFWLTLGGFTALFAMHLTYWMLTHPLNDFWLDSTKLTRAATRFFALGGPSGTDERQMEWTILRDRWELSHAVRAGFGLISLVLLVTAVAL